MATGKTDENNKKNAAPTATTQSNTAGARPLSDIELAVKYSRALEALLAKNFGATGTGLFALTKSVENRLPKATVARLRQVAWVRNKVVHEVDYAMPNRNAFMLSCQQCEAELKKAARPLTKEELAARAAKARAADQAYVTDWFREVGVALAVALPGYATFFLLPNGAGHWRGVGLIVGVWSTWFMLYIGFPMELGQVLRYLRTRDPGPLARAIRRAIAAQQVAQPNNRAGYVEHRSRAATDDSAAGSSALLSVGSSPTHHESPGSTGPSVNPASGLPMMEGTCMDIGGNLFGSASDTDPLHDAFTDNVFGTGGDLFDHGQV